MRLVTQIAFFTLRNKPEWQKCYGINIAPQDSMVFPLEKEAKGKGCMKRHCSSGSIGQRCLKLKSEEQDNLDVQGMTTYPPNPVSPGTHSPASSCSGWVQNIYHLLIFLL